MATPSDWAKQRLSSDPGFNEYASRTVPSQPQWRTFQYKILYQRIADGPARPCGSNDFFRYIGNGLHPLVYDTAFCKIDFQWCGRMETFRIHKAPVFPGEESINISHCENEDLEIRHAAFKYMSHLTFETMSKDGADNWIIMIVTYLGYVGSDTLQGRFWGKAVGNHVDIDSEEWNAIKFSSRELETLGFDEQGYANVATQPWAIYRQE